MNLEPGWEKKALIILAVITCILVIYSYGSMKAYSNNTTNQTVEQPSLTSEPQQNPSVTGSSNSNSTNNTNTTNNTQNQNVTNTTTLQQGQGGGSLVKS